MSEQGQSLRSKIRRRLAVGCGAAALCGTTVVLTKVHEAWIETQPQWECKDIPQEGMGPKQALAYYGKWRGTDSFPIEVQVPQLDGTYQIHEADTAEQFDGPYVLFDFHFDTVPYDVNGNKTKVCWDKRKDIPTPTPQSSQIGRQGHHVVYSRTGK